MMKKFIIIMMALVVLVFAKSSFAACQANINMGGNRFKNVKTFEYDDATAANYAATRDYVDGILTPIKVYWQGGGHPKDTTFNTFGLAQFSATATNGVYVQEAATASSPQLPGRLYISDNCTYDEPNSAMSCTPNPNSFPIMYDISGIKYKKNFSLKFDYKLTTAAGTAGEPLRVYLKSSKLPTAGLDINTGGIIFQLEAATGTFNFYYLQNSSSTWQTSFITGSQLKQMTTIQPLTLNNTNWHTLQINFVHVIKEDNDTTINPLLPPENSPNYIVSVYLDSWNLSNYRINLGNTLTSRTFKEVANATTAATGSWIGVNYGGTKGFLLRNFIVDSGMIPIGNL